MKILDCTLRDGGYYNQWDFESVVVNNYLKAMATANVDFVELGLRNFPKEGFLGASAYTTEKYLNSLHLPEGPSYGVMVDAKTILTSGKPVKDSVHSLFVEKNKSKLEFVRVAAHFHEVNDCFDIVNELSLMGYIVGLNLMQSGGKSSKLLTEKATQISSWGVVDVLYFADSLGNMDETEVLRIINAIKSGWKGVMGIHTHNNMGKALPNTILALDNGISWLDCTVTGMGRGAGNAETELLLSTLNRDGNDYNCSNLYQLVIDKFEPMKKVYGWGQNLLYFLGAQNEVHPSYIQNILSDSHIGPREIVGAVEHLCDLKNTTSYSDQVLINSLNLNSRDLDLSSMDGDNLKGVFEGQEILILADSSSINRYLDGIIGYINEYKPTVIALNVLDNFPSSLIDYYCVSHNLKYLSESEKYKSLEKPLIYPSHRFGESERLSVNKELNNLDYGIEIQSGKFEVNSNFAVIPYDLTVAYALAASVIGNAEKVNLIGFVGYSSEDERQKEMIELFSFLQKFTLPIRALTPTTYPITQGSIYEPKIEV